MVVKKLQWILDHGPFGLAYTVIFIIQITHNPMKLFNKLCCIFPCIRLLSISNNKPNKERKTMSLKQSVIDVLNQTKTIQMAAVGTVYDNMISTVTALPDDVPGDVTALQDQVAQLTTQLSSVQAAFDADEASLTAEKGNEAKLQAKLDAIKAALDA